jgi:hypothetical protein
MAGAAANTTIIVDQIGAYCKFVMTIRPTSRIQRSSITRRAEEIRPCDLIVMR